jgi:hypothetical protein
MDKNIKATTIGTLHKDLFFNKKVSISFDTLSYDKNAEYKVLVQIEPPSIMKVINQIPQRKNDFDLILAWHPDILSKCENSELFPFGSCWINEEDRKIYEKNKTLSIIASNKQMTVGHRIRHQIIKSRLVDMDIFGRNYNPIDNKLVGLKDYMFSLIIENDSTDNWFTEKIIDCLVTGTIPLYWGCSNIGDYFDSRGFIMFENMEDFKKIVPTITEEKYNEMLPFIKNNFDISLKYVDFWGRISNKIKEKLR